MASHHHTTFAVKKEQRDFSPGCGFRLGLSSSSSERGSDSREDFELDMDLSKFLGEPDIAVASNELEPTEWNSLFSGTELEGLDFLDPTTGVPTSANMTDHSGFTQQAGVGGSGSSNVPAAAVNYATLGQSEVGAGTGGNSNADSSTWLFEQSQKLERQQQLQQQKLLELEQTLLRTEILKNRLEIVSNLKHASPELQTQLIGALSNRPASLGGLQSSPVQVSLTTPATVAQRLVNRANIGHHLQIPRSTVASTIHQAILPQSLPSPPESELEEVPQEVGGKKKSHNLIEKKYRTSINDRIGVLRDMVSKHFKDDRKMQKSAVLQKTIDYINYLENFNRRLMEENKQLKTLLKTNGHNLSYKGQNISISSHSNSSPFSWSDTSEDDTSPTGSPPPLHLSPTISSYTTSGSSMKMATHIFMCFMLVMCFFVDPLPLIGGYHGNDAATAHGYQRTLNSVDGDGLEIDGIFTMGWFLTWFLRFLFAGLCFGWSWIHALPTHNPEWEGVRFWRLRKQAEAEIKKGNFSSAQVNLVESLTDIGLPIPTSYMSLTLSLIWNGFSHLLFQIYIGQLMVYLVSFVARKPTRATSNKSPQSVSYADIAKTKHLLHQISLAAYEGRTMHGLGFYLGLTALNYGEVERCGFSRDQWAELLFAMGVQCQFSCACIASLLARYYFLCAGNLGGFLSFINSEDGWDFLMSKEWVKDVQTATKLYKDVAVYPKYSVARSYCKVLMTEGFRDLLLPHNDTVQLSVNTEDCKHMFDIVLDITRNANNYLVEDMKQLTGALPSLSDTVSTRDCGFEVLMWWASLGVVTCQWTSGKDSGTSEHYPVIEDLPENSGPIPSALHLAFKAQRLYHQSVGGVPPLSVMNQLFSTASHALKTCDQSISSEDNLHLLGLYLACHWLLSLRYVVWKESNDNGAVTSSGSSEAEETLLKHVVSGYKQDIDVLSQLTSYLPGAFPQLSKYKGYQRLISGGNPILADSFLSVGGSTLPFRHRNIQRSSSSS